MQAQLVQAQLGQNHDQGQASESDYVNAQALGPDHQSKKQKQFEGEAKQAQAGQALALLTFFSFHFEFGSDVVKHFQAYACQHFHRASFAPRAYYFTIQRQCACFKSAQPDRSTKNARPT